jgi:3'-5' exoribonuclease
MQGQGRPRPAKGKTMSKQLIGELVPGEPVYSYFTATDKALVAFKNRSGQWLGVTLTDRTGSLSGRAWNNAEELASRFEAGDVVQIQGQTEEYQGKLQIVIEDLHPAHQAHVDRRELLPAGKHDPEVLLGRLYEFIGQVQNPCLRALLEAVFGDNDLAGAFSEAPGAKALHHSHMGGLIEHTVGVVTILLTVQELHPELDRDLLITSGLLHDLGKLQELKLGASIDYTDEGRLLGHIVLTDRALRPLIAQIEGFPPELDMHLNHILLSHHGQKEYGAPIVPMTAEACALHYADNLDAHVQYFGQVIEKGQAAGGRWTEYQRLFERYLYIAPPEARGGDADI